MALARVDRLTYAYPGARPALTDVSLKVEGGELVCLLGLSGSGKSTLLRALAGLVPHFHGGRFAGRVEVGGRDTRSARPSDLAGTVASVFQDPEDQVVFTGVAHEVAFGLENLGVAPGEIHDRVLDALRLLDAEHLAGRRTQELSAGELQRVCVASALAFRPRLLLLDEPTSQLDPDAAELLLEHARELGCAVVVSEQRPALPLERCDRVVFLDEGRVVLDGTRADALCWLADEHPAFLEHDPGGLAAGCDAGEVLCSVERASFAYGARVVRVPDLELRRGEIVALTGPNGSGKTTLAKLAVGLLEPAAGLVWRKGRASYLSQDPGRYVVAERVDEEAALGVGDLVAARRALELLGLAGFDDRHPRDLSSGERERLGLASVLVTEPDVLVLDEPTRGMDPERKLDLAAILRSQAARRSTLVVTHDLVFAADVADRVVGPAPAREVIHA